MRHALVFLALVAACSPAEQPKSLVRGPWLFVFAGAAEHHGADSTQQSDAVDFLAVIDADTNSATYARVIATAPIGVPGTMPHHTELEMPPGGRWLFANAFMAGKTYLFDLTEPSRPKVAGMADSVPGLRSPHSFFRLPDGNVVGTMQFGDGREKGDAGGLALFTPEGRVMRTGRSVDKAFAGAPIRTYALDVAPATDRVVTTSSPMNDERTADVVQLWRLSDLSLLRTIPMPTSTADSVWRYPFEIRFLSDGKSAFMNTWYCAFYHLTRLDGETPAIDRVLTFDFPRESACGVPLLVGHWWIMPVGSAHTFVVLDISDPRAPRRVSELVADSGFTAHWMSREPGSNRIAVSSDAGTRTVRLVRFDSTSGRLSWDEHFRERPDGPLGVSFDRTDWPHGGRGVAAPHGVVFSRR